MSIFFHVKDGNGRPTLVNRDRICSILCSDDSDQGLYIQFGKDDSLMVQPGAESDRVWKMFFDELPPDAQARIRREEAPESEGKDDRVLTSGKKLSSSMLSGF
jgi:hypothetical protein